MHTYRRSGLLGSPSIEGRAAPLIVLVFEVILIVLDGTNFTLSRGMNLSIGSEGGSSKQSLTPTMDQGTLT